MKWVIPFGIGGLFALTADTFAQDAGLYSSEERGMRALPGEEAISEQLMRARRELDARDQTVSAKEKLLSESAAELEARMAENQQLRDDIDALLQRLDAAHTEEVARQIQVYEKMRGPQAAPILSEMKADIVLPILRGMRADKAAKILAAMDPKKAARLSEKLNEDPATELNR